MNALKLFIIGFFLLNTQCQTSEKQEVNSSWTKEMHGMAVTVTDLVPFVYDHKAYSDPKNHKVIEKKLTKLSNSSHKIPLEKANTFLGKDPLIVESVQNLQQDLDASLKTFKQHQKEYSRAVVKNSLGYCFRCHTRDGGGPEYTRWQIDLTNLQLGPIEKSELYVATRQYDKAIKTLLGSINSESSFYDNPYEQENALKHYLAIMVKVKKDPATAHNTLENFLRREKTPLYLVENISHWKKSLKKWMAEGASKKSKFSQANKLLRNASKVQEYQAHEVANVEYLRATGLLHESLKEIKNKELRAKAYERLGRSYSVLSELGYWNLPQTYYSACIREYPRSDLAKKCYKEFERNIVLGFTGSAGTFLPALERKKLKKLKKMAGLK